jgi:hypothetical protein
MAATLAPPSPAVSDLLRSAAAAADSTVTAHDPTQQQLENDRDTLISKLEVELTGCTSDQLDDAIIQKHIFPAWKPGMNKENRIVQLQCLRKQSHAAAYTPGLSPEMYVQLFQYSREKAVETLKLILQAEQDTVDTVDPFFPPTCENGSEGGDTLLKLFSKYDVDDAFYDDNTEQWCPTPHSPKMAPPSRPQTPPPNTMAASTHARADDPSAER